MAVPTPPSDPTLLDKISAASLASPLRIHRVSVAGGLALSDVEVDLVISGIGFSVLDVYGNPRVRALLFRNEQASQVFDHHRFQLSTFSGVDYLGLRATFSIPGTYTLYLLDKDGALIASEPGAILVS